MRDSESGERAGRRVSPSGCHSTENVKETRGRDRAGDEARAGRA